MSPEKLNPNKTKMKEELKLYKSLVGVTDKSEPELIVSHYVKNELAGVAGLVRRHSFPSFFIIVIEKHRKKGIGKKLTVEVIKEASQKYSFMILTTTNPVAKKIFEEVGFLEIFKNPKKIGMVYWFKPSFANKILIFFISLYKKYLS